MGGAPRYANGEVPTHLLVREGEHLFFPGTYVRWCRFRDAVKRREGVTLRITSGPNAYRDKSNQSRMRAELGNRAAVPGTSSHGGIWTGQTTGRYGLPSWVGGMETGALDIDNWAAVSWGVFVEEAEKVGFWADVVVPKELWHIVDPDPWGHNIPAVSAAPESVEENDMAFPVNYKGHKFLIGLGQIKHFTAENLPDFVMRIATTEDEWHQPKNAAEWVALLDGFGIPREVVGENGAILNPQTGKHVRGGMWSWAREASVKADRILAAIKQ